MTSHGSRSAAQHVAAVQVLVHEPPGGSLDGAIHVERCIEQATLERHAGHRILTRYGLGPAISLVGEQSEGVAVVAEIDLKTRHELAHDVDLVGIVVPQT